MRRYLGSLNVSAATWQCLVAALLLLFPLISRSGTEEAKVCLAGGDYACALREFSADAQSGHALAQLALGLIYANGLGVARSESDALAWFTRAADQGNGYAQYNVGLMNYVGRQGTINAKGAIPWFRRAATAGIAQAQNDLGVLHFFGHYEDIEYPEALSWLQKAASQGHLIAQINLAFAYLQGGATTWRGIEGTVFTRPYGVAGTAFEKDEREAARWFLRAAQQGVLLAQFNLGYLYENGVGVAQSHVLAVQWYAKAAAGGFIPACMPLAMLLESGVGVTRDAGKALSLRTQSSRYGIHKARSAPVIVYYFGSNAMRHADGLAIFEEIRKLGALDEYGAFHSSSASLLVDPDLSIYKPSVPAGPVTKR